LVKNWDNEFQKWLGKIRIQTTLVDQSTESIADFFIGRVSPVLIMSYEMVVKHFDTLSSSSIDLLVCDEGHRLKNLNAKYTRALNSLKITRKIILSGTPIQNSIVDLINLLKFVNPNLQENLLHELTSNQNKNEAIFLPPEISKFILRRDNCNNRVNLKSKYEFLVFCELNEFQKKEYRSESEMAISGTAFTILNNLKRIANHSIHLSSQGLYELSGKYAIALKLLELIMKMDEKVWWF
jgi:SNF2 family DNA or RNA helicase